MTFVLTLHIFLASYSLNKNVCSVGEEQSHRKQTTMCSPFSTAFWRNSLSSYQNLDRTQRKSRLGSIHEETDDHVLFDKDSESFRNFASPKQILSHTWRERLAEKLPLWQNRQSPAPKSPACCPPCGCFKSGLGLFLTTASGILFAIASLFVKLSNTTIPSFEIVFFRLIIQTLLVLPAAVWAQADLLGEKKHRPYLVCFGAVNFASISCIYGSFTKLPLGDATVCISTTPIFTALVAYVFLRESWHIFDAVATFICLGGVILITRPTFLFGSSADLPSHVTETSHLIGYGVALSGAVVQSLTFVMVRRVGSSVSFYTNVFYFGWCSALLSGFTMFIFQKPVIPDCGAARWFLVGVAICGVFGSFCLNRGLQLEKAAPAALMRNVDILLAFLFDYAIFGHQPRLLTLLGGLLVVLSTGGVALAKWWRSRDTL